MLLFLWARSFIYADSRAFSLKTSTFWLKAKSAPHQIDLNNFFSDSNNSSFNSTYMIARLVLVMGDDAGRLYENVQNVPLSPEKKAALPGETWHFGLKKVARD